MSLYILPLLLLSKNFLKVFCCCDHLSRTKRNKLFRWTLRGNERRNSQLDDHCPTAIATASDVVVGELRVGWPLVEEEQNRQIQIEHFPTTQKHLNNVSKMQLSQTEWLKHSTYSVFSCYYFDSGEWRENTITGSKQNEEENCWWLRQPFRTQRFREL